MRYLNALLDRSAASADIVPQHQPFFSSTSGVLVLLILTVGLGGLMTLILNMRSEQRARGDRSTEIQAQIAESITRLQEQIAPTNRPGVIERLNTVERLAASLDTKLTTHMSSSSDDFADVRADLAEIRRVAAVRGN